jgi:Uma2 family endonuclease
MVGLGFFQHERLELIRGTLVRTPPMKPAHASAVDLLMEALVQRLAGRARVRVQQPFVAADESEPEPDLAVVPLADYSQRHPDRGSLLIEVAETSLEYDRETKGPLYAASGVPEYWVADVKGRVIEVHTEPMAEGYGRVVRAELGASVSPAAFPEILIAVSDVLR